MTDAKKPPGIWGGQFSHFCLLALLLTATWLVWDWLKRPVPIAFWIAVSVPVLHQVFVWLAWRTELQSSFVSKAIGFNGYLACFFTLFLGRFATLIFLAWSDRHSLAMDWISSTLIMIALVGPGVYALYSVGRYFGMKRAAGADHFEPRFRSMPLVNKGIFRFTNNGMYVFAFFLFWAIGIGFRSSAALLVAAFSHAYIWVHFLATEKPDMDYLYSAEKTGE